MYYYVTVCNIKPNNKEFTTYGSSPNKGLSRENIPRGR